MRKIALLLALVPGLALAQVSASFRIDLPVVLPRLVVIQPGIRVVPDVDAEVFFSDGYYWSRDDDGRWFRSRDHRGHWVYVQPRGVPPGLARIPPGQYKRWHGRPYAGPGYRGAPGPVYRGAPGPVYRGAPGPVYREREDRDDEHEGRGHGHGHGNGHWKHGRD